MTYDRKRRRNTALALKLKRQIGEHGPISVADYMNACLQDPAHGYYRCRTAIGAAGDFITAPEITQVFGELIGMWCAVVWQQMGSPGNLNLIELGPGRGSLMRDVLRAAKVLPRFGDALAVHLIESSTVLAQQQKDALAGNASPIEWHEHLHDVPAGPSIIFANEFLDTIEVDQIVKVDEGWRQRGVSVDQNGRLCFVETHLCAGELTCSNEIADAPTGAINETQLFAPLTLPLAELAAQADATSGSASASPMAALFIDYGYNEPLLGETLQAVRNHKHEHPLTSPGEADLTAHVDFDAFSFQACGLAHVRGVNFACDGPVTQAEFLGNLGIAERTALLMQANPGKAGAIEMASARLMAPQGMGTRFKAIAIRSKSLSPLPGFAPRMHRAR